MCQLKWRNSKTIQCHCQYGKFVTWQDVQHFVEIAHGLLPKPGDQWQRSSVVAVLEADLAKHKGKLSACSPLRGNTNLVALSSPVVMVRCPLPSKKDKDGRFTGTRAATTPPLNVRIWRTEAALETAANTGARLELVVKLGVLQDAAKLQSEAHQYHPSHVFIESAFGAAQRSVCGLVCAHCAGLSSAFRTCTVLKCGHTCCDHCLTAHQPRHPSTSAARAPHCPVCTPQDCAAATPKYPAGIPRSRIRVANDSEKAAAPYEIDGIRYVHLPVAHAFAGPHTVASQVHHHAPTRTTGWPTLGVQTTPSTATTMRIDPMPPQPSERRTLPRSAGDRYAGSSSCADSRYPFSQARISSNYPQSRQQPATSWPNVPVVAPLANSLAQKQTHPIQPRTASYMHSAPPLLSGVPSPKGVQSRTHLVASTKIDQRNKKSAKRPALVDANQIRSRGRCDKTSDVLCPAEIHRQDSRKRRRVAMSSVQSAW